MLWRFLNCYCNINIIVSDIFTADVFNLQHWNTISHRLDKRYSHVFLRKYTHLHQMSVCVFSLERGLKFLHYKLTEIFLSLYLSPRQATVSVTTALTSVTSMFQSQLGDYKEYLAVKAQRNITMTTYPIISEYKPMLPENFLLL